MLTNRRDRSDWLLGPLFVVANAVKKLAERLPTDPRATRMKDGLLRTSIFGKSIPQSPISSHHDTDGRMRKAFRSMVGSSDTHLSLISAVDIGCHAALEPRDMDAISLHMRSSPCDQCYRLNQPNIASGAPNPHDCWRRGHHSKRFGFMINQTVVSTAQKEAGWMYGEHQRVMTSPRLSMMIDAMGQGLRTVPYTSECDEIGRRMVVGLTVKLKEASKHGTHSNLQRVLDAQYLHSSSLQERSSETGSNASSSQLYTFIKSAVEDIHGGWRKTELSRYNSLGVVVADIVFAGDAEPARELLDAMPQRELQRPPRLINIAELDETQREFLGLGAQLGGDNPFLPKENECLICLFLDPIMDLVMPHG